MTKQLFFTAAILILGQSSLATPCGDLIYKNGKLRKYEYVNNSGIENTKKHGSSTTAGVTTEGSTASVDPGVSTGVTASNGQSTSTQGECKWAGFFATNTEYNDYLNQNLIAIKNEISLGRGGHLEILASAMSCSQKGRLQLPAVLQKNFELFVDFNPQQSAEFATALNQVVVKNLDHNCSAILPTDI